MVSGKNNLQMIGKEAFLGKNENSNSIPDNLSDLYEKFTYNNEKIFQSFKDGY